MKRNAIHDRKEIYPAIFFLWYVFSFPAQTNPTFIQLSFSSRAGLPLENPPTTIQSSLPGSFPCPAREPWELGALAGRPDLFSRKKNFSIYDDSPGRSVFLNIIHGSDRFSAKTVESATGLLHF